MSWASLGLLSIIASWVGLLFMIMRWKGNASMTFSQHAAQYRVSRIYYAVLWLICLPPFYWFMINPFADRLELGVTFKVFVTLGTMAMLGAGLIPELPGWRFKVHRFFAFSMAALLLPTLTLIVAANNVQLVAVIVTILSIVFMLWSIGYVWFETALKHKVKENPHMLPLQATYIAVFHVSVLVAYYL